MKIIRSIRSTLFAAVLGVTALAYGGIAQSAERKMAMTWSFEASHLGYLAAQDKGFFKSLGVDVIVERGHGAGDTIRRLVTGDIDFGIIDATMIVQAMANDPNAKLVMVANILQTSPYNVLYVKGRKIKTIGDLAGSKFGDTGGSVAKLYPTFMKFAMKDAGKAPDKYERLQLSPAVRMGALFKGDVDVVASVIFEWPNVTHRAKAGGIELGTFTYADAGFDPYTYGIVVRKEFAEKNPEVVRKVVQATLMGWQWACNNRKEAAALMAKHHGDVPPETIGPEVELALKHVGGGDAKEHGLGHMNPKRWEKSYELAILGWGIDKAKAPALKDVYDTNFMPMKPIKAACQ